ncbi:MAG TPA: MerR family transcriptional regulator, partial [Ramlibacter sp.]|nr:MerR family transcriptional regulator [Ramlibacter sp.]
MLNSKELLERTGISRATLNNYIALGIVPKPDVLPPEPADGSAPRIGYFPDETLQRIADIQRLKNEGWSMAAIADHFAPGRAGARTPPIAARPVVAAPAAGVPARRGMPPLTVDEPRQPAYLVDRSFAVLWANDASSVVLGRAEPSRNVFEALLRHETRPPAIREQLLRFHVAVARQFSSAPPSASAQLTPEQNSILRRLESESATLPAAPVSHAVLAPDASGSAASLYAIQFREGTLFVHVPGGHMPEELSSLLAAREAVPGEPVGRKGPVLSDVSVLAMELDDATRIWSALPAEEYFELINEIWLTADPIVRRHRGVHGKHPGDGIVSYFLPQRDTSHAWNALVAAQEMREAMRRISKEWQLRKG